MKGFESNLDQFVQKLDAWHERCLNKIGLVVMNDAAEECPKDTWELSNSITYAVDMGKLATRIGTNVDYAIFVEKGTGIHAENGKGRKTAWKYKDSKGKWHITRGQKAHPYLFPAIVKCQGNIKQVLKDVEF